LKLSPFIRQLLGTDGPDTGELNGTFTFRRRRPDINRKFSFASSFFRKFPFISHSERSPSVTGREELTDNDDEILESLVKTATRTATPRTAQRERKRTRNADRKSCEFADNFN
jgi:hypothetical protein